MKLTKTNMSEFRQYYIGTKQVTKDEWANYFRDNPDTIVVIKPKTKKQTYNPEHSEPISPEKAKQIREKVLNYLDSKRV